jgi:hypothetical protein
MLDVPAELLRYLVGCWPPSGGAEVPSGEPQADMSRPGGPRALRWFRDRIDALRRGHGGPRHCRLGTPKVVDVLSEHASGL